MTHGYQHGQEGPTHGPSRRGPAAHSPTTGGRTPGVGDPVVSDGTMAEGDDAVSAQDKVTAAEQAAGLPEATTNQTGEDSAFAGETGDGAGGDAASDRAHPDTALAAERLEDLRRLQAEYVNYKKRVDRDRAVARELGIQHVLEGLLPVLDDIYFARQHGDLVDGPFAAIADKLETALGRLGAERFGEIGDEFDPLHHEALMQLPGEVPEGATTTTVVQVLQPGYRLGERVVRAARVAVADPS